MQGLLFSHLSLLVRYIESMTKIRSRLGLPFLSESSTFTPCSAYLFVDPGRVDFGV